MADASRLYEEHSARLEGLAARITGDREDARDVVADAFVALLESGPSDPQHAAGWLYLTVRHRAYNRLRARDRVQRHLPALAAAAADADRVPPPPTRDPRIAALLSAAAAELSDRDRLAISLRHLEDAPYEDVAASLATTPAQARVVVHRAGRRLRQQVIRLLAHRHRAEEDCADSLVGEGRHQGCTRCVSVSDEVTALVERGVALPLARPSHLGRGFGTVRDWWQRGQRAAVRVTTCTNDAAASATAALAVTLAVALPAFDAPPQPSSPIAVTSASGAPGAPGMVAQQLDAPVTNVPERDNAGPTVVTPQTVALVAGAAIGAPSHVDDPGTSEAPGRFLDEARPLAVLGFPLRLTDALDGTDRPDVDISAFELATLAGEEGRAAALRIRMTFAAPPPENLEPSLTWRYSKEGCYSSVRLTGAERGLKTVCPRFGWVGSVGERFGIAPISVHLAGVVLEVTIPFASVDGRSRELFHAGAELLDVIAGVDCDLTHYPTCSGDRVPDHDQRLSYRVEK